MRTKLNNLLILTYCGLWGRVRKTKKGYKVCL